MTFLRPAAFALSLTTALLHAPASADAEPPRLSLGTPDLSNLYGLELNQWYVFANHVTAGTIIGEQVTQDGTFKAFPTGTDLGRHAETSNVVDGRLASAFARVSPTSLGAAASARDPLNLQGTGTTAIGYSMVTYFALLDQDTSFKFDIKVDGQLQKHGVAATSGAAVAALAYGSHANYTTEAATATFNAAGLDPWAEGDTLALQLSSLQSSTQFHLDVLGRQTSLTDTSIDIDTTLQVTAQGTQQNCDRPVSPACGRYFYFFDVVLFTGARDGGSADFSHTLEISSVSVGGGAAQPFNAISPVPEPAGTALLVAGLLGVGAAVRRTRQRTGGGVSCASSWATSLPSSAR